MSPRVDLVNTLPVQKSRMSDPSDRMVAEALDNLLVDHARSRTTFTIISLRDLLLQQSGVKGFKPDMLRYRVRDRLRTLEKQGLLEQVDVLGKCRKVFRLNIDNGPADPPATEDGHAGKETVPALKADDNPPASQQPSPVSDVPEASPETPSASSDQPAITDGELQSHLEWERHTLRTEMETVMGESEYYRQLLARFPRASGWITPLMEAAIAQGSRLKGQLDANIKLRRTLADEDREEGEA